MALSVFVHLSSVERYVQIVSYKLADHCSRSTSGLFTPATGVCDHCRRSSGLCSPATDVCPPDLSPSGSRNSLKNDIWLYPHPTTSQEIILVIIVFYHVDDM